MKTTMVKILWKKEKRHWKRTFDSIKKVNNWIGKIVATIVLMLLGNLVHYAFVIMSTLWQSILFIVARKRFKLNLQRQALRV
jgi:hypothetical protein